MANLPEIGSKAPSFELPDDSGEVVRLSSELARGPVMLFFYPADFSPGCTAQACMLRDRHSELADAGVNVLGVSPQSVGTHAKFRKAMKLPFRLLADPERLAIKAFGVQGPFSMFTRRATFLIGSDGLIIDRVLSDLNAAKHVRFTERALRGVTGTPDPS